MGKYVSIFDRLFEANICFAVCMCVSSFKIRSLENNRRDYYIIVKRSDWEKIDKLKLKSNFHQNPEYKRFGYKVLERDLSEEEVFEFKDINDKFIKVQHNSDGRIFEIRGNSFKTHYEMEPTDKEKEYVKNKLDEIAKRLEEIQKKQKEKKLIGVKKNKRSGLKMEYL